MENKLTALAVKKNSTVFRCLDCMLNSELPVERFENRPELSPHPFEYFAHCPDCGSEITEAAFIKNLYKAWLNPTGTKSPELSARNLPDPYDDRRRFNALKHGMFAKKAKYFPAKVGRYAECDGCAYSSDCESGGICIEISKVRMMVTRAFDSKNPALLQPLFQDLQSDLFVLLHRMMRQVLADGSALETPVVSGSKDGPVVVHDDQGKQLTEKSAHPLLKSITDMMAKNGLTLPDWNMTPKTQGDKSVAMGNLQAGHEERKSLQAMHDERQGLMEDIFTKVAGAIGDRAKDPIYQEQQEEGG